MDVVRRFYTTKIQPYANDPTQAEIRWFAADENAECLPFPTCFGSSNWDSEGLPTPPPPGEIGPHTYAKPEDHPEFLLNHYCGRQEAFLGDGKNDPVLAVNADNLPLCCLTTPPPLFFQQYGGQVYANDYKVVNTDYTFFNGGPTQPGSCLILLVAASSDLSTPPEITSPPGWFSLPPSITGSTMVQLWYRPNAPVTFSTGIWSAIGDGNLALAIEGMEWRGVRHYYPLDTSGQEQGAFTPCHASFPALSFPDELQIVFVVTPGSQSFTPHPPPWTSLPQVSGPELTACMFFREAPDQLPINFSGDVFLAWASTFASFRGPS